MSKNRLIGERIQKARKEKRMSMKRLGELVNLHESTVSRYEKGDIQSLDIEKMKEFANALDVSPAYLMGWKDDDEIGNKLKSLRIQKNISLMELASELHIDTMILKQYEEGIKKIPQELLEKFASYFDTTIDNLIGLDLEARRKHVVITNDDVLKERYEKWKKEVGYNQFNDEEVEQLIEIAQMMQTMNQDEIKQTIKYMKFLISQR